jgi:hypothetical protein
MKMKKNDDTKAKKQKKDESRPISYKAKKGCKSLDCFCCCEEKKES